MTKPTYKLTSQDRERIRSWLEKKPQSNDIPKLWHFESEGGAIIPITRVTQYIPGGQWKVRIAYTEDGGYPLLMSGPLLAKSETKKPVPPKSGLVPKNYAEIVEKTKAQLAKPSPIWDMDYGLAHPDFHITFKVQQEPGTGKLTPVPMCIYCGYPEDEERCDACTEGAP